MCLRGLAENCDVAGTSEFTKNTVEREDRALHRTKTCSKGILDERPRLIVYGSKARGDYAIASNIDMVIITLGLTTELNNQILNMVADVEIAHTTPISTLVFSGVVTFGSRVMREYDYGVGALSVKLGEAGLISLNYGTR
jgi:predicted nucleotidyltransferase